jgi:hypothetical protein
MTEVLAEDQAEHHTIQGAQGEQTSPTDQPKAIQPLTITRAGPRCVEFHQPDNIVPLLTSQQLGTPSGDRDQAEQLEEPTGERAEHSDATGDDPGDAQHDCPEEGDERAELQLQPTHGQGDDQADQINHGPPVKAIQPLTIMRAVTRCVEFHPPTNNLHVLTPNVQGTKLSGRDQAKQLVVPGAAQNAHPHAGDERAEPQLVPLHPTGDQGDDTAERQSAPGYAKCDSLQEGDDRAEPQPVPKTSTCGQGEKRAEQQSWRGAEPMKTDQAEENKATGGTSDPVHTKAPGTYLEDQPEQKQPKPPPPSRTIIANYSITRLINA